MGELSRIGSLPLPGNPGCGGRKFDAADAQRLLELAVLAENAREGTLTGYDCRECCNRGYRTEIKNGQRVTRECRCMPKRRSLKRIAESGLERLLGECTFERYQVREEWQRQLKAVALDYLEHGGERWLCILGQTGSGKTHLCTAVCKALLERGLEVRYLSWIGFVRTLERLRFKQEEREAYYRPIERAQVLYLDDFLKRECGEFALSSAFDLLDYREKAGLVTLLSGEKRVEEIAGLDMALASRIRRMCGKYCLQVQDDPARNWRLWGEKNG